MSILHKNARSVLYIKAKAVAESAAIFARIYLIFIIHNACARVKIAALKNFFANLLTKPIQMTKI